jgi:glutamate mutase epsilon subunit
MTETTDARLAVIETIVKTVQSDQEKLNVYLVRVLDDQSTRLRGVELANATINTSVDTLKSEVNGLRRKATAWGTANTILAGIAGMLGWGGK